MLDSKAMYEYLTGKSHSSDVFIESRADFLNQLVSQRKLKMQYHLIDSKNNKASYLIENF